MTDLAYFVAFVGIMAAFTFGPILAALAVAVYCAIIERRVGRK